MESVNVLVIDDDNLFYEIFKECIEENLSQSGMSRIDHLDDPSKLDNTQDYAIYVIDNRFHGQEMCFDIIENIRKKNPDARIFAATGYGDFDLIKRLWTQRIDGFIDKNEKDCSSLINMIEILHKNNEIMINIEKKVSQMNNFSNKISGA